MKEVSSTSDIKIWENHGYGTVTTVAKWSGNHYGCEVEWDHLADHHKNDGTQGLCLVTECKAKEGYYCFSDHTLPDGIVCPRGFTCAGGNASATRCPLGWTTDGEGKKKQTECGLMTPMLSGLVAVVILGGLFGCLALAAGLMADDAEKQSLGRLCSLGCFCVTFLVVVGIVDTLFTPCPGIIWIIVVISLAPVFWFGLGFNVCRLKALESTAWSDEDGKWICIRIFIPVYCLALFVALIIVYGAELEPCTKPWYDYRLERSSIRDRSWREKKHEADYHLADSEGCSRKEMYCLPDLWGDMLALPCPMGYVCLGNGRMENCNVEFDTVKQDKYKVAVAYAAGTTMANVDILNITMTLPAQGRPCAETGVVLVKTKVSFCVRERGKLEMFTGLRRR